MIIDKDFIEGKGPFGSYLTESTRSKWYPNVTSQLKTINTFVETGPFVPKYSEERYSNWELHYFYDFLLSGEDHKYKTLQLKTPQHFQNMMYPILSQRQYKSEIQQNKKQPASYTAGMLEEASLHKMLLKECQATSKLIQLSNQIRTSYHPKEEKQQGQHSRTHKKAKKKSRHVSSRSSKKIPTKKPKKQQTSSSSSTDSDSSSSNSSTTS